VLGQRTLHQQLAHTDPKAAADELDEQKAPGRVQLVQRLAQHARPVPRPPGRAVAAGAARTQCARPPSLRRACGGWQDVGDGLGQVAHGLVAGLEQPVVHTRAWRQAVLRSTAVGTTWRGLPPARKYTAQAASAAGASRKVAQQAATLSLVAVLASSASNRTAKRRIDP
jgi:hypothetical protein